MHSWPFPAVALGGAVRCMARRPECLKPTVAEGTEVVRGDTPEP